MKATIEAMQSKARNLANKKETAGTIHLVAVCKGEIKTLADARFYIARRSDGASPVYCSVWLSGPKGCTSGYGVASGYGYHKSSAALDAALRSAGFTLDCRIDGVGDGAIREALLACAKALGNKPRIYTFI